MAPAKLGRIALEVDDVEAVARDCEAIFGIKLQIHRRAEDSLGLVAGVGHDGIELVQRTTPDPPPAKYWKQPLAAIIV
jgi:hypothetical protein